MIAGHAALREALGTVGVWSFALDDLHPERIHEDVRAIEAMGYRALWIPEGGGSNDILTNLGFLLAASERLIVASRIANVSARAPEVLGRGAGLLSEAHDGRLVLGIGIR